ncbi:MAG: glycosyltransferase family 39 protein [Terriglobia bacterium]
MADTTSHPDHGAGQSLRNTPRSLSHRLILLALGGAIYLGSLAAPPSLMDDVDAVNAQIARTMLVSGDWVTARINGVIYLEKSPLGYWLTAVGYAIFGVHDWVARLPIALGAMALMFLTSALGRWAYGARAGFYSGLVIGTSVGIFLFTRFLIPDILLTLAITAAFYCFLRVTTENDSRWSYGFWACLGAGLLFKGLLGILVPVATGVIYLLVRRQFFNRSTWNVLRPISGTALMFAIYLPWIVLASLRNPPIFDFTLRSEPGVYHGFLWFYFINEHLLRFLNLRYPRDYNTVPRAAFWGLHLVWIFPWSVFLPAVLRSPAKDDRAGNLRLLAIIWIVFLLVFLSLSTTQEYYSMPCYPAFALLLGPALASPSNRWISRGYGALAILGVASGIIAGTLLYLTKGIVPQGDISSALTQHPESYTPSLGHMHDLTLTSLAHLRGILVLAALAIVCGTSVAWFRRRDWFAPICLAVMMLLFFHASRWAMAVFDPYLSSRPLADAILAGPEGQLVMEGHYYPSSSVAFYTGLPALLLNGRADNLVYGSAAPGVPPVFIVDEDLAQIWKSSRRIYLVAPGTSRSRLEQKLGKLTVFAASGGKFVFSNQP